ncbi:MAG: hypothetical protein ABI604_06575 [Nitrospirota bacterium]
MVGKLSAEIREDKIKGACQRMMPETVQRCVDMLIIQRGVARQ